MIGGFCGAVTRLDGVAVIVGGLGWSRAKIMTKATHPSAAITATPSATHFQRFDEGVAATGGAATGGEIFCGGAGGRLTRAIAGAGAGAGSGAAARGKLSSAFIELLS